MIFCIATWKGMEKSYPLSKSKNVSSEKSQRSEQEWFSFKSSKGPIPKIIRFANCSIRVKHTGQKVDEEKTNNNERAEKNEQETEQNKQQAEKNEQSAEKNEQQIQAVIQQPPETDWQAGQ